MNGSTATAPAATPDEAAIALDGFMSNHSREIPRKSGNQPSYLDYIKVKYGVKGRKVSDEVGEWMRDLQASQPSAVNTDEDVFDRVEPLTDDEIDYSQLLNSRTNEITSNPNESIMVDNFVDDAEIAGSLYSPIGIKIPSPAVKVASNNDVVLEDFDSTMETSEVNILEDSFTETIELEEDDCDQDSYAFDPTDKEFLAMVNNLQVQSSRYDGLLASVVNRDTLEEGTDLRSFVEVEEFEICED